MVFNCDSQDVQISQPDSSSLKIEQTDTNDASLVVASVLTDTINEKTLNNGVTVDSVSVKDGNIDLPTNTNSYQINSTNVVQYQNNNIALGPSFDAANGTGNIVIANTTAGQSITSGFENVLIGNAAGAQLTTGAYNVMIGLQAGRNTVSGEGIYIGVSSGLQNTSGSNIAIGRSALRNNTTGSFNTVMGLNARTNGNGGNGVFIGAYCGSDCTSSNIVAIGDSSLRYATGGSHVSVGSKALTACTTGAGNTALGYRVLESLVGANYATSVGMSSGQYNVQTDFTAVGAFAGQSNTGGSLTCCGKAAAQNNTADGVTAIGADCAKGNTGAWSTHVGINSGLTNALANVLNLGYNAQTSTTNGAQLGDDASYSVGQMKYHDKTIYDNSWSTSTDQAVVFDASGSFKPGPVVEAISMTKVTNIVGFINDSAGTADDWVFTFRLLKTTSPVGKIITLQLASTTISTGLGPTTSDTGSSWTTPVDDALPSGYRPNSTQKFRFYATSGGGFSKGFDLAVFSNGRMQLQTADQNGLPPSATYTTGTTILWSLD